MIIIRYIKEVNLMEVDILRTFVMLTKNKNFSKTAEMQNLVQSTVTNRIKELEKELGKQLFIRNKKSRQFMPTFYLKSFN